MGGHEPRLQTLRRTRRTPAENEQYMYEYRLLSAPFFNLNQMLMLTSKVPNAAVVVNPSGIYHGVRQYTCIHP